MYLSVRKSGKGHMLYLLESFRDKNGKPTSRVVHNYGRLEDIPPKELEKLKEQYANKRMKKELELKQNKAIFDELLKRSQEEPKDGGSIYISPLLHYGQYAIKKLWDDELNLYRKIGNIQEARTKITSYRLSDIALYLTSLKILDPCSHLHAFNSQYSFLGNFIEGVLQDNIYSALETLGRHKDAIIEYAAKRTLTPGSKPVMLFYDVTNCYFETAYDDREQFIRKFKRKTVKKMLKDLSISYEEIEQYLRSPEFDFELNKALEAQENRLLRFRGLSKEMRYDLPLVSIALIIDDRGIPLDFQIYKGNESEYKTMVKSIRALKEKYDVKNAYIVADRGLNSTANLHMLLKEGLGFVVAQKVKYNKQIKELIEDEAGWQKFSDGDEEENNFRYKIAPFIKQGRIDGPDGTKQKITIKCRIMLSFNGKRQRRDLKQLEEDKKKANEAIAQGKLLSRYGVAGWRGLLNTAAEDIDKSLKNSEKLSRASSLKKEVIAERKALAGYAAVVFSPSESDIENGISISEEELLGSYLRLVRIEECFRIMKTNFSLRPMYVHTPNSIAGHCLICVLALLILRLIQIKLEEHGYTLTIKEITSALYNATVTAIGADGDSLLLVPNRRYEDVMSVANAFIKHAQTKEDVDAIADLQSVTENYLHNSGGGDRLDYIFKALDLIPLKETCTVQEAGRRLRTRFAKKEDALGVVLSNILAANRNRILGKGTKDMAS